MSRITLKPDTLDQENRRFSQVRLAEPLFLNSLPKSGSHLLRNIVRMFVPVSQQYHRQFIQHANLQEHRAAFASALPLLSWGHLPFSDDAAVASKGARKILLVRDPYSWVLARARFFVSAEVQGDDLTLLKSGEVSVDQLLNLMIFGIHGRAPGLLEMYTHHVVAWLGTDAHLVRFETLRAMVGDLDSAAAADFFAELFAIAGVALADDWRDRVRVGADPDQSGTARANLSIDGFEFPDQLGPTHHALVDFAAPGLRSLLGYA